MAKQYPATHGVEYMVSPYGEVGWVHDVRADPTVTLSHGSKTRQARLEEVADRSGAAVVAAHHARESFSRPYMDAPEDPTIEDFESRAGMFPVFGFVSDL